MSLAINPALLRAFATPAAPVEVLSHLRRLQLQKRLLQVVRFERAVRAQAPGLGERTGFLAAHALLRQLPPARQSELVALPAFGRLAARASDYLRREALTRLPDGPVALLLCELAPIVAVGAARAGIQTELRTRLDESGLLPVPGLDVALDFGAELPFQAGTLRTSAGRLEAVCAGARATLQLTEPPLLESAEKVLLRRALRLRCNLTVSDFDTTLRMPGAYPGEREAERLDAQSAEAWSQTLEAAFDLLAEVQPGTRAALAALVTHLVPLRAPKAGFHNSASASETLGVVEMSFDASPHTLAEALTHELHHMKLNLLADVVPMFAESTTPEAVFFSPWRNDARPLIGILHGAFVFQAVAALWCDLRERTTGALRERAEGEIVRRAVDLEAAFTVIEAHAELTHSGRELVSAMRVVPERIAGLGISEASWSAARARQAEHRRSWEARHGRPAQSPAQRGPTAPSPRAKAISPAVEALCRELGLEWRLTHSPPESLELSGDTAMDSLGRLFVLEPERFGRLAAQIESSAPHGPTGDQVLLGHVEYVRGNHQAAATAYHRALLVLPDDMDTWRCFVFALRHLGFQAESDAWLFAPVSVTRLARKTDRPPSVEERARFLLWASRQPRDA